MRFVVAVAGVPSWVVLRESASGEFPLIHRFSACMHADLIPCGHERCARQREGQFGRSLAWPAGARKDE